MGRPIAYQIKVRGRLGQGWSDWFDDMTLAFEHGITTLTGPVADQSALLGILCKLGYLNVTLLSVCCLETYEEVVDVHPLAH